jgi:hypothetical protein
MTRYLGVVLSAVAVVLASAALVVALTRDTTGPRGIRGPQGEPGAAGPSGERGATGSPGSSPAASNCELVGWPQFVRGVENAISDAAADARAGRPGSVSIFPSLPPQIRC